jgi:pilus assembly protein Flp/PilA
MKMFARRLMRDEQGQDLIEYGLLAALISVLCVTAVTTAGTKISDLWSKIGASIP